MATLVWVAIRFWIWTVEALPEIVLFRFVLAPLLVFRIVSLLLMLLRLLRLRTNLALLRFLALLPRLSLRPRRLWPGLDLRRRFTAWLLSSRRWRIWPSVVDRSILSPRLWGGWRRSGCPIRSVRLACPRRLSRSRCRGRLARTFGRRVSFVGRSRRVRPRGLVVSIRLSRVLVGRWRIGWSRSMPVAVHRRRRVRGIAWLRRPRNIARRAFRIVGLIPPRPLRTRRTWNRIRLRRIGIWCSTRSAGSRPFIPWRLIAGSF